ncbi:hypothetical protein ACHAXM_006947 [Skeletonema potamos]
MQIFNCTCSEAASRRRLSRDRHWSTDVVATLSTATALLPLLLLNDLKGLKEISAKVHVQRKMATGDHAMEIAKL